MFARRPEAHFPISGSASVRYGRQPPTSLLLRHGSVPVFPNVQKMGNLPWESFWPKCDRLSYGCVTVWHGCERFNAINQRISNIIPQRLQHPINMNHDGCATLGQHPSQLIMERYTVLAKTRHPDRRRGQVLWNTDEWGRRTVGDLEYLPLAAIRSSMVCLT